MKLVFPGNRVTKKVMWDGTTSSRCFGSSITHSFLLWRQNRSIVVLSKVIKPTFNFHIKYCQNCYLISTHVHVIIEKQNLALAHIFIISCLQRTPPTVFLSANVWHWHTMLLYDWTSWTSAHMKTWEWVQLQKQGVSVPLCNHDCKYYCLLMKAFRTRLHQIFKTLWSELYRMFHRNSLTALCISLYFLSLQGSLWKSSRRSEGIETETNPWRTEWPVWFIQTSHSWRC